MKTFAFVDSLGQCVNIMSTAQDQEFVHLAQYNNTTAIELVLGPDEGIDRADFLVNKVWNGTEWVTRPQRNSSAHVWNGTAWVFDIATAYTMLRNQRNAKLLECDWTQVADAPVNAAEWAAYRQQLRDLPSQYQTETDFANVVWPTPPN